MCARDNHKTQTIRRRVDTHTNAICIHSLSAFELHGNFAWAALRLLADCRSALVLARQLQHAVEENWFKKQMMPAAVHFRLLCARIQFKHFYIYIFSYFIQHSYTLCPVLCTWRNAGEWHIISCVKLRDECLRNAACAHKTVEYICRCQFGGWNCRLRRHCHPKHVSVGSRSSNKQHTSDRWTCSFYHTKY